ncbi:glycosyltransferase [Chryseobacterium sp. Leaf394]|uniref:glycosyltransferase family 2 protein n=1 Tax=Chryseobacterium sp. Leaf394 TaxID=1736361 RepID=UPI0006F98057|nr:glycosyltransferase [Chryseobacterium sp. Leaf394]KQS95237.1 glycosyl transferase family 2 [Chryseobacterium sp. Leaf394]
MKFSILIANYNNGKFFEDCYHSIMDQTFTDWEAVILDDASTDDSLEIISELVKDDSRFNIFKNEKNSGVGITKSKLIELANGNICGFVDPDDAITPNALQSAADVFLKDSKTVLTYSSFMKCDKDLKPLEQFRSGMQVVNNDPYFFNCPVHIVHFVCFRKDVYEQTEKMNSEMRIAEDQDLYLKMYEKGKVKYIDEPNYLYRTHSGGISQNENLPKSREYFARVIFNTMKRRGLKTINGKKIPSEYSQPKEIYDLLEYQNSIPFRIMKKLKIMFQ